MKPVIDFYAKTFEQALKRKPAAANYARAAKAITQLPAHVTTDDLKRAVEIQLTQRLNDQYESKRNAIYLHEIVGIVDLIFQWEKRKDTGPRPRVGERGHQRQPSDGNFNYDQYTLEVSNG